MRALVFVFLLRIYALQSQHLATITGLDLKEHLTPHEPLTLEDRKAFRLYPAAPARCGFWKIIFLNCTNRTHDKTRLKNPDRSRRSGQKNR